MLSLRGVPASSVGTTGTPSEDRLVATDRRELFSQTSGKMSMKKNSRHMTTEEFLKTKPQCFVPGNQRGVKSVKTSTGDWFDFAEFTRLVDEGEVVATGEFRGKFAIFTPGNASLDEMQSLHERTLRSYRNFKDIVQTRQLRNKGCKIEKEKRSELQARLEVQQTTIARLKSEVLLSIMRGLVHIPSVRAAYFALTYQATTATVIIATAATFQRVRDLANAQGVHL